jgi:hypothetical protein
MAGIGTYGLCAEEARPCEGIVIPTAGFDRGDRSIRAGGGADDDFADVDVVRLVDGEGNGAGDGFGGDGDLAEIVDELGGAPVGDGVGEFGSSYAGGNDGDAEVGVFLAKAVRDGVDGEFRGAVDRTGRHDRVAADGGNVDDLAVALLFHQRQHGGDAVEDAADVDVDHLVPFVDFQRFERRERHQAGVVDDDIDMAVLFDGDGDEGLHVFEAGDIERGELDGAAFAAQLGGDVFEAVGAACADDDVVAAAGEQAGGGFADAAAGTGDEDDFRGWGGGHDVLEFGGNEVDRFDGMTLAGCGLFRNT